MTPSAANRSSGPSIDPERGTAPSGLVRAVGRWGLTALTVNCVVGAGVLGLPGKVFALAGAATGWVVAGAAGLALASALCLAELGSRMDGSGGPVEYCRIAFGRTTAFAVGWLLWTATVLAAGSLLNLLATLIAPQARVEVISATGVALTLGTMSGIKQSTTATALFATLKLILLAGVALAGLAAPPAPAFPSAEAGRPAAALVLLFFAFVGFERPTAIAGEVAEARRAVPFALITGMAAVTLLYAGVIGACWRGVPALATSDRPVGDLAVRLFGTPAAAGLNSAAALIVAGTLASQWITAPRLLLALAEGGELPQRLARLSARRRTPDMAIAVTGVVAVVLALSSDFAGGIAASSASRLLIFISCAAAVLRLRGREDAPRARFRLPAGATIATCVIVACAALLAAVAAELTRLGVLVVIGGLVWLMTKSTGLRSRPDPPG